MGRLLLSAVVACCLVACPAPGPIAVNAWPVDAGTDAGAAFVDSADSDAGGALDGGADASVPAVVFETVHAVGFQRLVHGPTTAQADVIAVPVPTVLYELGASFVSASVRELDAGLFEFDVPVDAGYYVAVNHRYGPNWNVTVWGHLTSRTPDLGYDLVGRADGGPSAPSVWLTVDAGNRTGTFFEVATPGAPSTAWLNCYPPTPCSGFLFFHPGAVPLAERAADYTYVSQYRNNSQLMYGELERRGWTTTRDFSDRDASYLEVELHSPDASLDVTVDVGAFFTNAALTRVHPNAFPGASRNVSHLFAFEYPWNMPGRFFFSRPAALPLFQRYASGEASPTTWSAPRVMLPVHDDWKAAVQFTAFYDVYVSFDGGTVPVSAAHGVLESPFAPAGVVAPEIFPPANLRMDGTFVPSSGDRTASSVTPLLSWSAPDAGIAPSSYTVGIVELRSASDGGVIPWGVFGIASATTALRVPPGALGPSKCYVFSVLSQHAAQPSFAERPFDAPRALRFATAVSNVWRTPP